jgi:predicted anti-sigma-YlaC factor YlaD
MMQDMVEVAGKLSIVLTTADGMVKDSRELDNLIVQVGKNYLAGGVIGSLTQPFTQMALGTGATLPTTGDTALQTQVARQAFTTASVSANVATVSTTFGAGVATGSLTEAGIFNAATAGVMLSRVVFSVVNKASTDVLTITWTITIG